MISRALRRRTGLFSAPACLWSNRALKIGGYHLSHPYGNGPTFAYTVKIAMLLLCIKVHALRSARQWPGASKDGKRESKTRLTESTGKLIEEGRGNIGGDFTLQARELVE